MGQHQRRSLKEILIGRPLKNRDLRTERIRMLAGLSILAPDALSSVAYGTEEILTVLAGISVAALWFSLPIALVIVLLLTVLVMSYRQVIAAYPGGGGAYMVGRDSLGRIPALIAGASLLVDYTLTIAVSVTAGVDALISAFPAMAQVRVPLDLLLIAIIAIINLRGVRESAAVFSGPTYTFVIIVLLMVGVGLVHGGLHGLTVHHVYAVRSLGGISLFLLLRAFSSGSSALTGVEAISNGVPIFREPSVRNAQTAMTVMGTLLGAMFLGTTVLAFAYGIGPMANNTVLSQLGQHVFGRHNVLYYILAFSTTAILALAANTSFSGFPQLAYNMALDKFMPHLFLTRGDRLVFINGIMFEAIVAGLLVIAFGGSTSRLIPLYAIGVYAGFTISQFGLIVERNRRARARGGPDRGDLTKSLINGFGGVLTAVVVVVFAVTKFGEGAWMVLIIIPVLVLLFLKIHSHYEAIAEELRLPSLEYHPDVRSPVVIVPVASLTRIVANALSYAQSISQTVIAVHVSWDRETAEKLEHRWAEWNPGVRLVTIESQFRSVVNPMVRYVDLLRSQTPDVPITIVIPEFIVGRWWQGVLHNQVGILLQARLLSRRNVVIATVPYRLSGR